ncbi:MAG: hypothetical protein ACE5KM_18335 [Planctomycetaceae bacterium]
MRFLPFCTVVALALSSGPIRAGDVKLRITQPMTPPPWALLERELLKANTAACKQFFARYFDSRGWLLCVERWGGDDGPDDAIENCNDWPILHALTHAVSYPCCGPGGVREPRSGNDRTGRGTNRPAGRVTPTASKH